MALLGVAVISEERPSARSTDTAHRRRASLARPTWRPVHHHVNGATSGRSRAEVITEFRRVELGRRACGPHVGRGGVRDVQEAIRPWRDGSWSSRASAAGDQVLTSASCRQLDDGWVPDPVDDRVRLAISCGRRRHQLPVDGRPRRAHLRRCGGGPDQGRSGALKGRNWLTEHRLRKSQLTTEVPTIIAATAYVASRPS